MSEDENIFEGVIPILRVANLQASAGFSSRVQNRFPRPWRSRVGRSRSLCDLSCGRRSGNPGSWGWVGVADAISLFEEYKKKRSEN
jgi:hypothetical protein